ncbi:hypothetical protein Ddye_032212 [Dipteronia dyeriana]|uniref:Cucumisin n=1 Tax=Dipteronia dyeriana TaxID=168575 RepID=A0AAD9TKZ7_9ROSI|nr:hypothetical protein Ddye_032212 [Dipteronia dyeriana]
MADCPPLLIVKKETIKGKEEKLAIMKAKEFGNLHGDSNDLSIVDKQVESPTTKGKSLRNKRNSKAMSSKVKCKINKRTSAIDRIWRLPLPTSYVNKADGSNILTYIRSNSNASATIFKSMQGNDTLAPYVVSFSSRGPNSITLDILKPDITAPGVNILAAWTPLNSVSQVKGDNRIVSYNMMSGTSMSCPHVSAIAAYIKSFHPTWSPAAIKSAIMTTATSMSATKNPEAEFGYGSGHINPLKVLNPGLVYDAGPIDYIRFLCGQRYSTKRLRLVTGDNSTCNATTSAKVWDLNYPSFALSTSPSQTNFTRIFNRVVTNVGTPVSTYRASVTGAPAGLRIRLNPSVLSFTSLGQTMPFTLTVEGTIDDPVVSTSLVWDDGVHQVRSPIVVFVFES